MFPNTRSRARNKVQASNSTVENTSSIDLTNTTVVSSATLRGVTCNSQSLDFKMKPQKRLGSKQAVKKQTIVSTKAKRTCNNSRISKNSGKSKQFFPIFNQPNVDTRSEILNTDSDESLISQSNETQNERQFLDILHDALADSQEVEISGDSPKPSRSEEEGGRGDRHAMDRHPVEPNPRDQSPCETIPPETVDGGRPSLDDDDVLLGSAGPSHAAPSGSPHSVSSRASTSDQQPEIEYLRTSNTALIKQLKEAESELSEKRNLCKRQQLVIKKLQSDKDELQKSLSTHVGVKKLFKTKSCGVGDSCVFGSDSLSADKSEIEDILLKTQSALELAHTKHERLKTLIQVHTSNMFSALEEDDSAADTPPLQYSAPISRRRPKRTRGEPIDVNVTFSNSGSKLNFNSNFPSDNNMSAWAESCKEVKSPEKIVIGSSLARGTSEALRHCGVSVSEYYFSGGQIPYIHGQIKHILEKNPQVKSIVLILGGNDCESDRYYMEDIINNYDALVDMIKLSVAPDCNVIISSVPQRRSCSARTHIRIAKLNESNKKRENSNFGVYFVDAAPRFGNLFYDRVHMNDVGLGYWAQRVSDKLNSLSNFQGGDLITRL